MSVSVFLLHVKMLVEQRYEQIGCMLSLCLVL